MIRHTTRPEYWEQWRQNTVLFLDICEIVQNFSSPQKFYSDCSFFWGGGCIEKTSWEGVWYRKVIQWLGGCNAWINSCCYHPPPPGNPRANAETLIPGVGNC
jgi:hypothetical protein